MKPSNLPALMSDLRGRYMRGSSRETGTALGNITAKTEDPFKVLISTILSQRTRDEMTEKASYALFAEFPDARSLAAASLSEVRRLIRPVGFYNQKSVRVREVSRIIVEEHRGKVPFSFEELVALPQVGPKTANCVLVYGFGIPAMPVDTHVHRITNRLGLVRTKTPEGTEAALVRKVPREYWIDFNGLLVRFGQEICRPLRPRCPVCSFRSFCDYYRKSMRR